MFNTWDALSQQAGQSESTPGSLDLSPQYDSNGYQAQFQMGAQQNPYDSLIGQGSQMAGQDVRASQNNQSNLGGQQQNYMQFLASSYPSFPNAAGAGNQMAAKAPEVPGTGVVGNGVQSQPVYASQSFNPWSLQGEALSRVK